jgi:hypothetical protein
MNDSAGATPLEFGRSYFAIVMRFGESHLKGIARRALHKTKRSYSHVRYEESH